MNAAVRAISIAALTCLAAVSCGTPLIGDPGYSVTVKNGTEQTLVYYVDDVGAKPGDAVYAECDWPLGRTMSITGASRAVHGTPDARKCGR
jgi:hypothetical protein